ncbi:MAG: hypothetical protein OWV35_07925 [Firmicutes bacterium]|nr:hypothetical protein [Bacillota bacterium]
MRHAAWAAAGSLMAVALMVSAPVGAVRRAPHVPVRTHAVPPRLGTRAWAQALRADLRATTRQPAPPLWIVPDLGHPRAWLILDPQAQDQRLWWAVATPARPRPRFAGVPVSLRVSNAAVRRLPPVLAAALEEAYALHYRTEWPVRGPSPAGGSPSAMTPLEAQAGDTETPVGWMAVWDPAYPGGRTYPGSPAMITVSAVMPWGPTAPPTELVIVSASVTARGRLTAPNAVDVLESGALLPGPVPVTDRAAYTPASVRAGLQVPGR